MGLGCTLGLVACLHFQGGYITQQDVLAVLDDCQQVYSLPPSSFIQHQPSSYADIRRAAALSWGAAMGEDMGKRGVKLEWPPTGLARKRLWTRTCRLFEVASDSMANWTKPPASP